MDINKIYNENCLDTMKRMPDDFIDLTVTSPPYDNLRDYKGYSFDFEAIANQLYRVTKVGGIVVWIVGDATINGSETGTSFKQALYFMQCGLSLFDTIVYAKPPSGAVGNNNGYWQTFEYMFVFCKGKPKTINLIIDRKNKGSRTGDKSTKRLQDGSLKNVARAGYDKLGRRTNIWDYNTGNGHSTVDNISFQHPAIFPEQLAADHIYSWSNEGDLIYDPFTGSGTTLKMAHLQKRNWIGSEISSEYSDLATKRIAPYLTVQTIF